MRVDIGGGFRLFVDVDGSALVPDGEAMRERPVMLALHGGPGLDHSLFKPHLSALTDVCQVVYYDHRGHGRSDRGDIRDWTLDTLADDLVALCGVLGLERPVVFGNSFGGAVVLRYLAKYPDRPGKVIVSSTMARVDVRAIVDKFTELGGVEVGAIAQAFWTNPRGNGNAVRYVKRCIPLYTQSAGTFLDNQRALTSPDAFMHFIAEMQSMDLLPGLAGVRCDTLLLAGALDPVCPVSGMEAIRDALQHARVRYEIFPNAGHGVFRDSPDRAWAIMREFVNA